MRVAASKTKTRRGRKEGGGPPPTPAPQGEPGKEQGKERSEPKRKQGNPRVIGSPSRQELHGPEKEDGERGGKKEGGALRPLSGHGDHLREL